MGVWRCSGIGIVEETVELGDLEIDRIYEEAVWSQLAGYTLSSIHHMSRR
jgi:hypothetical protein